MTQKEKKLIEFDICSRFPYGDVYVKLGDTDMKVIDIYYSRNDVVFNLVGEKTNLGVEADRLRPYLKPLSSLTEEDMKLCRGLGAVFAYDGKNWELWLRSHDALNWLIANHYDVNGLIDLGLALPALEWMYREVE